MKLLITCILLGSVIVSGAPAPAPRGDFEVRLSIEPSSGLRGIPPTMRIEVQNLANEPAPFPIYARLRVEWKDSESEASETFVADDDNGGAWKHGEPLEKELEIPDPSATVLFKAKEKRTYTIWSGPVTPWWSVYPRLKRPGKYVLQVLIPVPAYESNKVTYTVLEPAGVDAAAWKAAQTDPYGAARTIAENYPDSVYARYYIEIPPNGGGEYDALINSLERAIRMELPGRWIDERKVALAQTLNRKAHWLADTEQDYDIAKSASDRARDLLEDVIKNGVDIQDRELAQKELKVTFTHEMIDTIRNEAKGIYPDHIYPEAECVQTLTGGKKLLWWSYNNLTNVDRNIAIGENNKFTPVPHDRGQPTVFETAYNPRVFGTPLGDEQSFTWHLYKDSLHITRAEIEKLKECVWPSN